MTFTKSQPKYLQIQFQEAVLYIPYDNELELFLETIKNGTAEKADIRVFENYFGIMWPVTIHGGNRFPLKFTKFERRAK